MTEIEKIYYENKKNNKIDNNILYEMIKYMNKNNFQRPEEYFYCSKTLIYGKYNFGDEGILIFYILSL
jgi:hypothetical protein